MAWVHQSGTCPLTQQPLRIDQLYPQFGLKDTIADMRRLKKENMESEKRIKELEARLGKKEGGDALLEEIK